MREQFQKEADATRGVYIKFLQLPRGELCSTCNWMVALLRTFLHYIRQ